MSNFVAQKTVNNPLNAQSIGSSIPHPNRRELYLKRTEMIINFYSRNLRLKFMIKGIELSLAICVQFVAFLYSSSSHHQHHPADGFLAKF